MAAERVLIVEDDPIVAATLEAVLTDAGFDVCGVEATERDAILTADQTRPHLAVVDVVLAVGDGRVVARELADRYQTIVVMATAAEVSSLQGIGAAAVVPKPYDCDLIPAALDAARRLSEGGDPGHLPGHMKRLKP